MCKLRYTLVFLSGLFIGLFIACTIAASRIDDARIFLEQQEVNIIRLKIKNMQQFYDTYATNLEKDRQIDEMVRARVVELNIDKFLRGN